MHKNLVRVLVGLDFGYVHHWHSCSF